MDCLFTEIKCRAIGVLIQPNAQLFLKLLLVFTLFLISSHAFADGGTDVAAGAADDLVATEKGTGMKFIYALEFIVAAGTAVFKRDIRAFFWVFGIATFATFFFGHFLTA